MAEETRTYDKAREALPILFELAPYTMDIGSVLRDRGHSPADTRGILETWYEEGYVAQSVGGMNFLTPEGSLKVKKVARANAKLSYPPYPRSEFIRKLAC